MRKFVIIKWYDACDVVTELRPDQLEDINLPLMETIGEIVHSDVQKVVLRHHQEVEHDNVFKCGEEWEGTAIPRAWIYSITELIQDKEDVGSGLAA